MTRILLRLFIAGRTSRSERAIAHLRRLCAQELAQYECDLRIVDVLVDPQQSEDERIIATPTLIKETPLPARRIIGDLSNLSDVLFVLNLPPVQGDDAE